MCKVSIDREIWFFSQNLLDMTEKCFEIVKKVLILQYYYI